MPGRTGRRSWGRGGLLNDQDHERVRLGRGALPGRGGLHFGRGEVEFVCLKIKPAGAGAGQGLERLRQGELIR
jgi:hypothetical protein